MSKAKMSSEGEETKSFFVQHVRYPWELVSAHELSEVPVHAQKYLYAKRDGRGDRCFSHVPLVSPDVGAAILIDKAKEEWVRKCAAPGGSVVVQVAGTGTNRRAETWAWGRTLVFEATPVGVVVAASMRSLLEARTKHLVGENYEFGTYNFVEDTSASFPKVCPSLSPEDCADFFALPFLGSPVKDCPRHSVTPKPSTVPRVHRFAGFDCHEDVSDFLFDLITEFDPDYDG